MNKQQPTWVGLRVEDCLIEEAIGEGSFSWVYKGAKLDGNGFRAFKCAKPAEFVERQLESAATQAKGFFTGGACDICPDAHFLLVSQARQLQSVSDPALVTAERLCADEGLAYYQMEYLDGRPLESLNDLIELCRVMSRLSKWKEFKHHGDLKPANVIVTADGIKLIDPGYFGPIDSAEGQFLRAAITTPNYYPHLVPDDILAVGIMAWQILLYTHPFASDHADKSDFRRTPGLRSQVKAYGITGNFHLDPLLTLPLPSEINSVFSSERERTLLKALRLKLNEAGELDLDKGFSDFDQLAAALITLK